VRKLAEAACAVKISFPKPYFALSKEQHCPFHAFAQGSTSDKEKLHKAWSSSADDLRQLAKQRDGKNQFIYTLGILDLNGVF
jgi:hypothetical protein